jgi:hypothetical protein
LGRLLDLTTKITLSRKWLPGTNSSLWWAFVNYDCKNTGPWPEIIVKKVWRSLIEPQPRRLVVKTFVIQHNFSSLFTPLLRQVEISVL